jgi:hypothetical protein
MLSLAVVVSWLAFSLELDRPQQGILRVDQGPMMRLADALQNP